MLRPGPGQPTREKVNEGRPRVTQKARLGLLYRAPTSDTRATWGCMGTLDEGHGRVRYKLTGNYTSGAIWGTTKISATPT